MEYGSMEHFAEVIKEKDKLAEQNEKMLAMLKKYHHEFKVNVMAERTASYVKNGERETAALIAEIEHN